MTVGVFCEEKRERVTFEQCIDCAKCLPAPIIKNLRIFENKPLRNVYDFCVCERVVVRSPGCIPKRVQNPTKIRLTRTAFCIDSQ